MDRAVTTARRHGARDDERGSMLIETLVAMGLLLAMLGGLLSLGAVALTVTENQGHLAGRTTEYAQDKMEQLLALAYTDATSDTRVFPAAQAGGTGLAVGGSSDPTAPVAGYADYLDRDGNLLASPNGAPPAGWFYKRVWQVANPSLNLKQITVTATVESTLGQKGPPRTVLVAFKSSPF